MWRRRRRPLDGLSDSQRDTLSADERARADQFAQAGDRARFVATRSLLRFILGDYLGIERRAVAFAYAADGKPMLSPTMSQHIKFNVSHAGDQSLVAVALETPVGVDVEPVRPLDDLVDLADLVFSPSERVAWDALPESERLMAFFEVWTRKEAVLKGLGAGLSRPPREIEVGSASDGASWQDPAPPHTIWRLTSFCPWPGYAACVAVLAAENAPTPTFTYFDAGPVVHFCPPRSSLDPQARDRLWKYLDGDL